jgi:DNA-directed RNA polymerase subunit RPC12/RpoP
VAVIDCALCRQPLPAALYNRDDLVKCPNCGAKSTVRAYPALVAPRVRPPQTAPAAEDEAPCFFHPHKKAETPCQSCGRFICALCGLPIGRTVMCPSCLEKHCREQTMEVLVTRRPLYDSLALALTLIPLLFFLWPSLVGAPAALFVSIRYWKAPTSILGRNKIRFIMAMLLALSQIALWVVVIRAIIV